MAHTHATLLIAKLLSAPYVTVMVVTLVYHSVSSVRSTTLMAPKRSRFLIRHRSMCTPVVRKRPTFLMAQYRKFSLVEIGHCSTLMDRKRFIPRNSRFVS